VEQRLRMLEDLMQWEVTTPMPENANAPTHV